MARDRIARFAGGGPRPLADATDLVVRRGAGSYLYDLDDTPYLDTVGGFGVASLGHSHPEWVERVIDQARRLAVAPLDNDALDAYLVALSRVMPFGLEQIALYSGGAEAVETAIRLGQTSTGRPGVLAFSGGFHGKTAALRYIRTPQDEEAVTLGPTWLRIADYPLCTCSGPARYPACTETGTASLEEIRNRADLDQVGTVIVEPIQGTSGNLVPARRFLASLRQVCDQRDWALIFDESVTGFGRTGRLFACEYFGVRPDVVVLSKGLGGGFPMSAVCAGHDRWARSALARPSSTTTAYGGNPVACAAGRATLEIITNPGFLEDVCGVADYAAERLETLATNSPRVARPRGVGLLLGFDHVDPETGEFASLEQCQIIARACLERGVLTAAHLPRVRINPPLTLSRNEVDVLFDVLDDALT